MFKNLDALSLGLAPNQSETIELALSHGFQAIELDLVEFVQQAQSLGLDRARRLISSARLKIGTFPLPLALDADPDAFKQALDHLPALAETARELGATRATVGIEPASDTHPYHENFELHRRRLGEVAAALAPFQIRLGLEFRAAAHWREARAFQFIHTFEALVMLVRNISAANLGLALDLWNWRLGGGAVEQIRGLPPEKIVSVSLADCDAGDTADGAQETSRRLPSANGTINAAEILTVLAELGFDGPVTPKPDLEQFRGIKRDKVVKQISDSLSQVWKAAGLGPGGRLQKLQQSP